MTALVTLAEAKAQLRIDHDDDDPQVQSKAADATAIVVDYLKRPDHGWTDATAPRQAKAAILIVLTRIYDDRSSADLDPLDERVRRLLERLRDPAFA